MATQYLYSEIFDDKVLNSIMETLFETEDEQASVVYREMRNCFVISYFAMYSYGFHVLGEWESMNECKVFVRNVCCSRIYRYRQELYQMNDKLNSLTIAPTDDTTIIEKKHSGTDGAMSENSPINASFDITTPFVKSKGENEYTDTETVSRNTVSEALDRAKILEIYRARIADIVHHGLYATCEEYNCSW